MSEQRILVQIVSPLERSTTETHAVTMRLADEPTMSDAPVFETVALDLAREVGDFVFRSLLWFEQHSPRPARPSFTTANSAMTEPYLTAGQIADLPRGVRLPVETRARIDARFAEVLSGVYGARFSRKRFIRRCDPYAVAHARRGRRLGIGVGVGLAPAQ